MCLLLGLPAVLQIITQLLQTLGLLLFFKLQVFQADFAGGNLLAQFDNRGIFRVGRQLLQLIGETALTLGQTLQALLQLGDSGLLHLGLTPWFGAALVEAVPLFLPAMHGCFGFFQAGGGLFGRRCSQLLLRLEHGQLFAQSCQ